MAVTVAQLVVKVGGDTNDAEDKLKKVNKQVNDSGGFFKNALSSALGFIGAQAGITGFSDAVGFLKDQIGAVFTATNDEDQATAQLKSTLQSTGGASGETMKALQGLADSLSSYTDYSKPAIEQSQKVLLTFTQIGRGVFPDATKAAADLAARMGIDLQSASLLVGKALNDPIKGMAALHREGVDLSAAQQEQVKHFMKVGDVADAQRVILGELSKEMGGAAKAAGSTLGGQLDIAEHKLDDVRAQVGEKLEPELGKLLAAIMPIATTLLNKLPPATDATIAAFQKAYDITSQVLSYIEKHEVVLDLIKGALIGVGIVILASVVPAFIGWAIAAGAAAVATIVATLPVIAIIAAIALLVTGIMLLVSHWKQVTDFLSKVWHVVMVGVQTDLALVGGAFSGLGTLVHNIGNGIGQAFKGGINLVIGDIDTFIRLLDAIQIHIPAVGVGPVKTPAFDWNGLGIPQIPYLAEGGDILKSGLAMVGERGPEPVWLPGGAQVRPNSTLGNMAGASGGPIQVILQVDGRKLAEVVAKYQPGVIRNATGVRAF